MAPLKEPVATRQNGGGREREEEEEEEREEEGVGEGELRALSFPSTDRGGASVD